jgi:hypothetical protein
LVRFLHRVLARSVVVVARASQPRADEVHRTKAGGHSMQPVMCGANLQCGLLTPPADQDCLLRCSLRHLCRSTVVVFAGGFAVMAAEVACRYPFPQIPRTSSTVLPQIADSSSRLRK